MQTNRYIYALIFIFAALISCKPGSPKKEQELINAPESAKSDSMRILYIGTYTENVSPTGGKSSGIYVYELNMNTGRLSMVGNAPQTVNPSYLVPDHLRQRLFAVNEIGSEKSPAGTVSAYRLARDGRDIEFINSVSSEGNYPCYVSLDGSGRFVMCANYGSGTVAVFPVMNDGSLGKVSYVEQHTGKSHPPRQESAHAHMIIPSPDNRFVYSCDLGTDKIYIYKLDTLHGKLIPSGAYSTQAGAGPRHMAFHPTKNFAYEVNELNGTIEAMELDTATGNLKRIQVISTVDDGEGKEAACADIHLTPSGDFLYASNRGKVNSLAIYKVDRETGKLMLIGHQPVKGKTPRSFVIDPEGRYLIVANQDSDNVVTFRIEQSTGKLIDTGLENVVPSPVCLKFLN